MSKKHILTKKQRNIITGYSFIGIWIIGFVIFSLYPLFESFHYSLNNIVQTTNGLQFTSMGFKHYINIFTADPDFLLALSSYVIKTLIYVPIIIVFSLMISILLNQKIKFRGFFRSIFFLPVIIVSGPILSELIKEGSSTVSLINKLGLAEAVYQYLPSFLANPIASLLNEFILILWFSGVQIVLFLSVLQKINTEMYNAAKIDGANAWETFWKITLPSVKGIIIVNVIYTTTMISTIATEDNIKLGDKAKTPLGIIKESMFKTDIARGGFGYTSAMAWVYFLVVILTLGILLGLFTLVTREKKD
ncbi:MAG: sugar ABC transporter permease [Acholeplasmatales bacterium]|jgi:ABC-type sugar transport system permease subunit|nr:sugar ABC transporter permease [Acholeplasmatales bacterium]